MEGKPQESISTLGVWTPRQLASRILAPRMGANAKGALLAQAAAKFHADMGLSNDHTASLLKNLHNRDTYLIRFAHQPNLFPYTQICAQTLFLNSLAQEIRTQNQMVVSIVFLVDYDIAGAKWMKLALIPDPRAKNELRQFDIPLTKLQKATPAYRVDAPSVLARERLAGALHEYANTNHQSTKFLLDALGFNRNAASLADFNAYAWVRLAVRAWDLPILFLRLSDVAPLIEPERRELAAAIARKMGGTFDTFLWRSCEECGRRVVFSDVCCSPTSARDVSIPNVLVDDLADYAIFGVDGGTFYASGLDHLRKAHRLGGAMHLAVPNESCWRLNTSGVHALGASHSVTNPEARRLVASGRSSIVEHLLTPDGAVALRTVLERAVNSRSCLQQEEIEMQT